MGEDNNTEHYRYRTLINFFKLQTSFDDKNLEQILLILQSDNDKTMAGSATVILLKVPTLTDKQFGRVTDFLQAFGKWTVKQIDNARINRVKYSSIKK